MTELIRSGRIQPQDAARIGAQIGSEQAGAAQNSPAISLRNVTEGAQPVTFDVLAYMAPGMALMFLMFTVSNGGRTLLAEQRQGTLPRLLVTPISTTQVLGGKVFGIYLTGVAQMVILVAASSLLFSLKWGDFASVLVLILAAVVGAVGWGMLITSLAKTPGQVSSDRIGSHAHLWHPGWQLYQSGKYAALAAVGQQDYAECLGVGRVHHSGFGRWAEADPGAGAGPDRYGCYPFFHRGGRD